MLYSFVTFGAGAVLPLDQAAGSTLTNTARAIFPTWAYYMFMFGGPVFAILTTMNAGIMNSALPVIAGVKEGWLPSFLAKRNKHGAYYVSILIIYVISLLPSAVGMNIKQITNATLIIGGLNQLLMVVAGFAFPFRFKKEWKESWLYIPNAGYFILMGISAIIQVYVIVKSVVDLNLGLALLNLGIVAIALVYAFIRMKKVTITETLDV